MSEKFGPDTKAEHQEPQEKLSFVSEPQLGEIRDFFKQRLQEEASLLSQGDQEAKEEQKKEGEKAQGYAGRWYDFVRKNPEVDDLDNIQWEKWCQEHRDSHPGALSLSLYRDIAKAVKHARQRKKRIRKRVWS
jgi:hypothetical protein